MFEVCPKIAANGHGLAMWWNLKIVRPEPQPNKNTKDEANKQKPNRITSAETAADSDKMPKLTTFSHHIAKPPVVCWASSVCPLISLHKCYHVFIISEFLFSFPVTNKTVQMKGLKKVVS